MVCTVVLINRLVFHSLAASMFFVMQTIRKYLISMVGRGSSRSWRGFDFSCRKERQRRIQGGGEVGEEGRERRKGASRVQQCEDTGLVREERLSSGGSGGSE